MAENYTHVFIFEEKSKKKLNTLVKIRAKSELRNSNKQTQRLEMVIEDGKFHIDDLEGNGIALPED